jgi:single-strand DNA-binding protein
MATTFGINRVYLVGVTRNVRTGSKGADGPARFWVDTTERFTRADGTEGETVKSVRVYAPIAGKVAEGMTVFAAGPLAVFTVNVKGVESKITEVQADSLSQVMKSTTHRNELIWAGRLGFDPDMRYTAGGVAVTEIKMVQGGNREKNEPGIWLNVVSWRGQAEYVNRSVAKGSRVTVMGRVFTDSYEAKDGSGTRYTTKCEAAEVFTWEPPQYAAPDEGAVATVAPVKPTNGRNQPVPAMDDDGDEGIFDE